MRFSCLPCPKKGRLIPEEATVSQVQPGPASALCGQNLQMCFTTWLFASGPLLPPPSSRAQNPCLISGWRAGTVPLFPGLQTSTLFYFYFSSLDKKNIAHQLMQRKSWGEEEGGRTFILALGHLAHLNFHIVSVENAFLSQKPQKDPTCSWLGMLYSRCWFGLCMEVGHSQWPSALLGADSSHKTKTQPQPSRGSGMWGREQPPNSVCRKENGKHPRRRD